MICWTLSLVTLGGTAWYLVNNSLYQRTASVAFWRSIAGWPLSSTIGEPNERMTSISRPSPPPAPRMPKPKRFFDGSVSLTFDDFQNAAIKLTDPSKNRFGFGMRGAGGGEGMVIEVMRSFGSPIVDDKGQPAMDRQKATDAVRWYSELFTRYHAVPPSVTNDSVQQIMTGFGTGQTAMLWHHTGSLIDVGTALGADSGKFGTLTRPSGPAAHIADVSYSYNGMSDPKNAEADWAWLDHWAQPDTQIAFLESTGYFPSSTKVVDDARVQKNPYYAAAIETLKFGGPAPAFAGSSNWGTTVLLPNFQRVLLGEIKPEEAVDVMMKGLDK